MTTFPSFGIQMGADSGDSDDHCSISPLSEIRDQSDEGVNAPRKIFSCRRCSYSTDRKNNLKRHLSAMHEVSAQKLECCGCRFFSKADLKSHNSKFHLDGYKCPSCEQQFVRKALLERHFSVHTGEKKFSCSCGYRTSHKSNLERHYKTHLKESCQRESFNTQDDALGIRKKTFNQGNIPPTIPTDLNASPISMSSFQRPLKRLANQIPSNEGNRPPFPYSWPLCSRVSLPSVLRKHFPPKTAPAVGDVCAKRKLHEVGGSDTPKRGFTVDDILTLDSRRNDGGTEKGIGSPLILSPLPLPQYRSQIKQMDINNSNSHYNVTRPTTYTQKFSRVLKPCPVYRGISPFHTTLTGADMLPYLPSVASTMSGSLSSPALSSSSFSGSVITSSSSFRPLVFSNNLPSCSSHIKPTSASPSKLSSLSTFSIGAILSHSCCSSAGQVNKRGLSHQYSKTVAADTEISSQIVESPRYRKELSEIRKEDKPQTSKLNHHYIKKNIQQDLDLKAFEIQNTCKEDNPINSFARKERRERLLPVFNTSSNSEDQSPNERNSLEHYQCGLSERSVCENPTETNKREIKSKNKADFGEYIHKKWRVKQNL